MNLKKTIFSVVGAAMIIGSMFAPVVAEEGVTKEETSTATVTEKGDFGIWTNGVGVTFGEAFVSTKVGDKVTVPASNGPESPIKVVQVRDDHASSDGYVLRLAASDLKFEKYYISNTNLEVKRTRLMRGTNTCLATNPPKEQGGNSFQHVEVLDSGTYFLDTDLTLVTAGSGRGCGEFALGLEYTLHVPEGTYTGGESTTYKGTLTFTTVIEP